MARKRRGDDASEYLGCALVRPSVTPRNGPSVSLWHPGNNPVSVGKTGEHLWGAVRRSARAVFRNTFVQ